MKFRLLQVTLCALLAGCAMGPDYTRPEVGTPPAWLEPVADGESIANLDWWQLFNDENLNQLITLALENNKDLAIAVARIEEARASLGFVRADQFPGVNGQAGASRGNTVPGIVSSDSVGNYYVLAANAGFEVDLWGRLRRATESARASLLASEEARNAVMITLIADVASSYLLLLDLDHRVRVAERTLDTRRKSTDIIQSRFERGIVPLLDVNQAQVEQADAAAELAVLERQNLQAQNLLNVLLGQNPTALKRGNDDELALYAPEVPAGLPSELLERRPDIREASSLLHAQMARIGVAEAARWPTLSLTGTLGLASNELSGLVAGDNKIWDVNTSLLGSIFDAGRNRSRVEVERARTEQALLAYEQTILRAFREVEDALGGIRTWRDEALARQQQVKAARSATVLSRARYDGGVTSYLEVLESERSLFRAELLASSSQREQLVAVVTLYKALGGGWLAGKTGEATNTPTEAGLFRAAPAPDSR